MFALFHHAILSTCPTTPCADGPPNCACAESAACLKQHLAAGLSCITLSSKGKAQFNLSEPLWLKSPKLTIIAEGNATVWARDGHARPSLLNNGNMGLMHVAKSSEIKFEGLVLTGGGGPGGDVGASGIKNEGVVALQNTILQPVISYANPWAIINSGNLTMNGSEVSGALGGVLNAGHLYANNSELHDSGGIVGVCDGGLAGSGCDCGVGFCNAGFAELENVHIHDEWCRYPHGYGGHGCAIINTNNGTLRLTGKSKVEKSGGATSKGNGGATILNGGVIELGIYALVCPNADGTGGIDNRDGVHMVVGSGTIRGGRFGDVDPGGECEQ